MSKDIVLASLPRAGLANKLLVWARALTFAEEHDLKLFITGWYDIKIGPYLRKEKTKRSYLNFFKSSNRANILRRFYFYLFYRKIEDELYIKIKNKKEKKRLYLFKNVPNCNDYFIDIRNNREKIRKSFYNLLKPMYQDIFNDDLCPVIGVHFRCSDFHYENINEALGSSPNLRTPINYFINIINKLRESVNKNLEVTLFTDGKSDDIKDILALGKVKLSPYKSDLADMIYLSKSKLIITSLFSTFGYWSSFISDSPVITHPRHKGQIHNNEDILFQGPIEIEKDIDPELLSYLSKL